MAKDIQLRRRLTSFGQIQARYTRIIEETFGAPPGLYGAGNYYSAGIGGTTHTYVPRITYGMENVTWSRVVSSPWHTLAIRDNGSLWGWGLNNFGQLGFGDYTNRPVPTLMDDTHTWIDVGCGHSFSQAITSTGQRYATGRNNAGQLGLGDKTTRTTWTQADTTWSHVACGRYHAAGIKSDGTVYTWGESSDGQLGVGSIADQVSPIYTGLNLASKIATGERTTFVVNTTGQIYVAGINNYAQLGWGPTVPVRTFTLLSSAVTWQTVASDLYHTLALSTDGEMYGWGANYNGSLAHGNIGDILSSPVKISSNKWSKICTPYYHSLGIDTNGYAYGWGTNSLGSLGLGYASAQVNTITRIPNVVGEFDQLVQFAIAYAISGGENFSLIGISQ